MTDDYKNHNIAKHRCFRFAIDNRCLFEYGNRVGSYLGRFPSGQRGQTVNLLAQPSKVQILLSPFNRSTPSGKTCFLFLGGTIGQFPRSGASLHLPKRLPLLLWCGTRLCVLDARRHHQVVRPSAPPAARIPQNLLPEGVDGQYLLCKPP